MPNSVHGGVEQLDVQFRMLGTCAVRVGEKETRVSGRRRILALITLLMSSNRPVSHTACIDAIWDGDAPPTARKQLATVMWQLRKTLAEAGADSDSISCSAEGYRLQVRSGAVDRDHFMNLVSEGRKAISSSNNEHAIQHLNAALELWDGDSLRHLLTPYLDANMAGLAELRMNAVEMLHELKVEIGQEGDTIPELCALVHRYPLRESLWRILMLALDKAGRKAEAVQTYRDARRCLIDHLGVEPSTALQSLHAALLGRGRAIEVSSLPADRGAPSVDPDPSPCQPPARSFSGSAPVCSWR